jgi:two-component system response regulator YesN
VVEGIIVMKILSQRSEASLRSSYKSAYGLRLDIVVPDGSMHTCRRDRCPCHLPVLARGRADAIQQAVRWGDPYVFFLAPGVMTWVVPLVDGDSILGGITGGEVVAGDADESRSAAINYLVEAGCSRESASRYAQDLTVWPQSRAHEAASYLFELVYQVLPLKPVLLDRNRENAQQQRQIAEAIQERKDSVDRKYPMREEQILLSLMRVGDRNGARRVLNDMLAAMFLYSPNLVLIRARAIEMMGFLVRAAIEDNPLQEPLMERHQEWIGHIVGAEQFEQLCEVLRHALDDFMDAIFMQGYNRSSGHVGRIISVITQRYMTSLSLQQLADEVGLSRFHVARLVKRSTGKTVTQHIRTLRVNRASELLESTDKAYSDIAYDLGFADQSYFIKQFREMTGTTPARYRQARQGL